jgi:hypothetical protein
MGKQPAGVRGRGRDGWSELPKYKSEELLCEGMGTGVDSWQFFLWPQHKHLQFSINIILLIIINIIVTNKQNKHVTHMPDVTITCLQLQIISKHNTKMLITTAIV